MIFSSHHPEAGSIWLRCILMVSTPSCLQNTHAIAPFILSMVTALEIAPKQQEDAAGHSCCWHKNHYCRI